MRKKLGPKLFWDDTRPTTKSHRISKDNEDIKNKQNWPQQHQWLYEKLEAFYKAFREKVKNLSSDYPPEDTENYPNENAESAS